MTAAERPPISIESEEELPLLPLGWNWTKAPVEGTRFYLRNKDKTVQRQGTAWVEVPNE